jgi:hypothetical protein
MWIMMVVVMMMKNNGDNNSNNNHVLQSAVSIILATLFGWKTVPKSVVTKGIFYHARTMTN